MPCKRNVPVIWYGQKHTGGDGMNRTEGSTLAFNRAHYGDLIRARRTLLGLSQARLAQRLGIRKAYVTHWEAGRARPDLNLVPALCAELGISVAAFFHIPAGADCLTESEQRHMEQYRRISERDRTVLDAALSKMAETAAAELRNRCANGFRLVFRNDQRAAAGTGTALDAAPSGEMVFVRHSRLSDRADEIVAVNGASMEPAFRDGQEVYIAHTTELEIGETGLFVVNGEGFIKQYRGDCLHSLNPAFDDIRLSEFDEARIVGRVLGTVDGADYPTPEEKAVLEEIRKEPGGGGDDRDGRI